MKPNRNYLFLIPEEKSEKKTDSGIVYELEHADKSEEATLRGTVKDLGEGVNERMINGNRISVGDIVHYYSHAGIPVEDHGQKIIIVHIKEVSHIE